MIMTRRGPRCALLLALLGFSSRAQATDAGVPPAASSTPPAGPSLAAPIDPLDLLVGTAKDLVVWGRDGKRKRVVSKGEARHPRWLNATTVVVMRTGGRPVGEGAVLETISLEDGARHRVTRIPKFKCAGGTAEDSAFPLDIQEDDDFSTSEAGDQICLNLQDRNINMASVGLQIVVSVKDGKVRRWLDLGKEECPPPAGVSTRAPPDVCGRGHRGPVAVDDERPPPAYPVTLNSSDEEIVVKGEAGGAFKIHDYSEDQTSPSKRWVVLSGENEDGDYIHRKLVLLDRQSGKVFPILEKGKTWPAPLAITGTGKRRRIKVPIEQGFPVVGETPVFWLGPASREILIVDHSVVVPGQFVFSFEGDLAR